METKILTLVLALSLVSCGVTVRQNVPYDGTPYAVETVSTTDTDTYLDFYGYLRSHVSGVEVLSGNKIRIRGNTSFLADTQPLILVDGVECSDPARIDVKQIASVEVIKDASASIYGFRGSNGVIKVTLKTN